MHISQYCYLQIIAIMHILLSSEDSNAHIVILLSLKIAMHIAILLSSDIAIMHILLSSEDSNAHIVILLSSDHSNAHIAILLSSEDSNTHIAILISAEDVHIAIFRS